MKKICLTIFTFIAVINVSFAQWTTSGTNIYNSNTGFVGVGTTAPAAELDVQKTYTGVAGIGENITAVENTSNFDIRGLSLSASNAGTGAGGRVFGLDLLVSRGVNTGVSSIYGINLVTDAGLRASGNTITSYYGVKSVFNGSSATSSIATGISNYGLYGQVINSTAVGEVSKSYGVYGNVATVSSATAYGGYFTATGGATNYGVYSAAGINYFSDNVSIGIAAVPTGYKLAVNGSVIANSVTTKATINWPDYVFKAGYKLPPLNDIKLYVKKNHHLPDLPSAQDIEKNGLNLGELDKQMVKKVEELTLYIVDQDNKVKQQKETISAQQTQITQLATELHQLEASLHKSK